MIRFIPAPQYESGFDDDASPPWAVLGLDRWRRVMLTHPEHLKLKSTDEDIVCADFEDDYHHQVPHQRVVRLDNSGKIGSARIHAYHGLVIKATLRVTVYPLKTVRINLFRIVRGRTNRAPSFSLAQGAEVVTGMNAIYRPQCRIRFAVHLRVDDISLDVDFATTDQSSRKQDRIWEEVDKLRKKYDNADSHLNVFCVSKWGARDHACKRRHCHKKARNVIGTSHDNLCIVEDMNSLQKRILLMAHELGHSLNASHDEDHEGALMYPHLNGGDKILRATVKEIRD